MPEIFPQQLKANFTPEQQDYYLQLENELGEIRGGRTEEEIITAQDFKTLQRVLDKKQEMLNFVLTKKTREMVKQEKEKDEKIWEQREEQLEQERRAVSLDEIERKQNAGEELTDNELKFLYRIDGFGFPCNTSRRNEARVVSVIWKRDIKQDVAGLLNCSEQQVSLTKVECLNGKNIIYHFGDLDLRDEQDLSTFKLPKMVGGNLWLSNVTDLGNLILPQYIGMNLSFFSLTNAAQLKLPQWVSGNVDLSSLVDVEELKEIPLGIRRVALSIQVPDSIMEELKERFPHVTFY